MKIYHKDSWGFWVFKRYAFYLQDKEDNLTEITVSKYTYNLYNIGDFYRS